MIIICDPIRSIPRPEYLHPRMGEIKFHRNVFHN